MLAFRLGTPLVWLLLTPFAAADIANFDNSDEAKHGAFGNYTRQSYLSDPTVIGPIANVLVHPQDGVSPSKYVTWAPLGSKMPTSRPMLIDANTFSTVWSGPTIGSITYGPSVQKCNGTDYLTWWAGTPWERHFGNGRIYMANSKYKIVFNVSAHPPLAGADFHEVYITPQCTAIVTGYSRQRHKHRMTNMTSILMTDSHFQEIDMATGQLIFHWQASKHIPDITAESPLSLSVWKASTKKYVDWFHINSIEKDRLGNYLVSARHTSTIYYVSGSNGSIIWRLGGSKSNFKDASDGQATSFRAQHHVRWVDRNLTRISVFDNRRGDMWNDRHSISRALVLKLDHTKREVSVDRSHNATNRILSVRKGSVQVLQDSASETTMVGYGIEPAWTEFAANGTVLTDVIFGPIGLDRESADNYRALKTNWTGLPYWGPKIAPGPKQHHVFGTTMTDTFSIQVKDKSGPITNDTVYFSWNGATEIASWIVLGSNDTMELSVSDHFLAKVPKGGFEDHVHVGSTKYVTAFAIDTAGLVLGATDVLEMDGFHLSTGLGGSSGNETDALTIAWQDYVDGTTGPICLSISVWFLVACVFLASIFWISRLQCVRDFVQGLGTNRAGWHRGRYQKYTRLDTDDHKSENHCDRGI